MKKWGFIFSVILLLVGCRQDQLTHDPTLKLTFSHPVVLFDTIFTDQGSSTHRLMVYNPHDNALKIKRVSLASGQYFHINLDGENRSDNLRNITIRGKDSLFLFVQAYIDPMHSDIPVLVEDSIAFEVGDGIQHVGLQAFGQNVRRLRGRKGLLVYDELHLDAKRPYLLMDTIAIQGPLTIDSGTTLYMHNGSMIYAYGDVQAIGSHTAPITIRGDRTDRLFDSVPYSVASGQWDGIYLLHSKEMPVPSYELQQVDIRSGSIGLYIYNETPESRPHLSLKDSRIHNHSLYGLVLQNTDADVSNCEISNAASYCVYLAGGNHTFTHSTVASYFGYPYSNLNIHTTSREDVAAVYIDHLSKEMAPTTSSFRNCIITGARKNNVVVATPLPQYYAGEWIGNYLKTDTLPSSFAHHNVYATDQDTAVFRNIHYLYKQYRYYDFRLDSLSPARGIADSVVALSYPLDRNGVKRKPQPDAGCYEYMP